MSASVFVWQQCCSISLHVACLSDLENTAIIKDEGVMNLQGSIKGRKSLRWIREKDI